LSEDAVRGLKTGDRVLLNGVIYTARDAAHKFLVEKIDPEFKERLAGSAIYHCGPVVKKEGGSWSFVSAGSTTSIREEPYEADIIKDYDVRAIIGKGGMGEKTLRALKEHGAVYLSAVGGMGAGLASAVKRVLNVYKLEFGTPEAIWEIEIEDFPAIVTMDSYGNSLHEVVSGESKKNLQRLL